MRCTRCKSNNADNARFCGDCGGELAQTAGAVTLNVCGKCGFENSMTQKFCGGCGIRRQQVAPQRTRSVPPERKIVTILFSDVSNFTSMSETLDPEDLRDLMNDWFSRLGRLMRQYSGTIDKFIGDAIMVLFGAPVARADDPRRAIDAAFAMYTELDRYNREIAGRIANPLQIRIGINTGRVYAGMVGGEDNRSYTVMGDAVNIASRLEGACPVGSVLINESTYNHVRGLYRVRQLEPLTVKGKTDPLQAYEVLGHKRRSAVMTGVDLGQQAVAPNVRTDETSQVCDHWDTVCTEGEPAMVVVTADPGMGKRRFVRDGVVALGKRQPYAAHLSARCLDVATGAFQVLGEMVRRAAGVAYGDNSRAAAMQIETYLRRTFGATRSPDAALGKRSSQPPRFDAVGQADVEEDIRLISYSIGLPDVPLGAPSCANDPRAVQQATLEATREWLSALSRQGPIVARIENLHWAPQTTGLLLAHLLATPRLPLLVVATAANEKLGTVQHWDHLPRCSFIPLRTLTPEQSTQVAKAMLRPLTPRNDVLVEQVATRSGGNPRFMEEIVRGLIESGIIMSTAPNEWVLADGTLPNPLPVPDTIGQLVQARVDRLHPSSKLALQWAAIAGSHFWLDQLCAIGLATKNELLDEPEEIEMALIEPLEAQLVVETDGLAPNGDKMYCFQPSLTQNLIYEGIVNRKRKQWHRQLAESRLHAAELEELDALELDAIATHLIRAEEFARAGQLYCRAGDLARSLYATGDAKVSYELSRDAYDRAGEESSRAVIDDRLAVLARETGNV